MYALLALHLCNRGRLLSVRPAPTLFDHLYASLHRAFGHTRPASMPGLSVGLPPLVPVGGFAPKQGCFGCLPKVLHDAKPTEQATLDTPFLIIKRFIDNLFPLYKIFYFCDYSVRLFKYKPYCRRYECAGNNCGNRKKRKIRKYGQRIYKRSR